MVEQSPLDYGTTSRPTLRRLLKRSFYVCLIVGLCAASIGYGCQRFYYYDRDSVRAHLESLPGVSVDRIDGFDDGPSWKVVYATVSIKGKPGSRLSFQLPTLLREGEHIRLSAIGPYQMWVAGYGHGWAVDNATGQPVAAQFYQDWFDIGPEGWFFDLLGTPIKGVDDVVKNYDHLLAAVEAMPKSGRRKLKDGSEVEWKIVGP